MSDSDNDDVPTLSAHTLAALQEFYSETRADTTSTPPDQFSVGALEEDWVSQLLLSKDPVCESHISYSQRGNNLLVAVSHIAAFFTFFQAKTLCVTPGPD